MTPTARVFRTVVFALAGAVVVFVAIGYMLTDRWNVSSSRVVTAAVTRVRPLLVDFESWQGWSGMTVEVGAGVVRTIQGRPGEVGHGVTWSGAHGEARLVLVKVAPDRLDYDYLSRPPTDAESTIVGRGHIRWRAEGDGTHLEWYDEGELPSLIARWNGWFGALQERVKTIQVSSLAGLQRRLEDGAGR